MYGHARKRIAVLMADLQSEYQHRIMDGIIRQAHTLQYDVLTFTFFSNQTMETPFQAGEENIFHLINLHKIDGILLHAGSFLKLSLRTQLTAFCKEAGIPYLDINEQGTKDDPVWQDRSIFQQLVDHLIEVHGYTRIYCLTGKPGFHQSEDRLMGYRDAMRAHGLECTSAYEFYGDFWVTSAKEFAEKIANGEIERPQAVACANAAMALALTNALIENGISVPGDVAVAGYDSYYGNAINTPSITAMSDTNYNHGVLCMCRLHERISGVPCESIPLQKVHLEPGESCGCNDAGSAMMQRYKQDLAHQLNYLDLLQNCNMVQRLSSEETLQGFMQTMDRLFYPVQGAKDIVLCICEDWDGISNTTDQPYRTTGYSDILYFHRLDQYHPTDQYTMFSSDEMLPDLECAPEPVSYYFVPLHFEDRCFGYVAVSFTEKQVAFNKLFRTWVDNVSTALETIRNRNYLRRFQNRIHLTTIRDPLTGMYNRKGFEELTAELYEQAVIRREKLLILAVDIDNLKALNLQHGYNEGDRAILTVAEALNRCCRRNEICCRCGEDNYYIIGCMDYTQEILDSYISILNKACAQHLLYGTTPMVLPISYGCFCSLIEEHTTLEQAVQIAHTQLQQYRQQKRNKTVYYKNLTELREQIYKNPQKKWNIHRMADTLLLSQGYFQRLYKKEFGVSVMADVIAARITLAEQLLRDGQDSIAEIAGQCGYENEVYFMQQFKKETGFTPTQYRKKHLV